jgi:site-specific DNA-cytosine methylase
MKRRNREQRKAVNTQYPTYPVPNGIEISSGGGLFSLAALVEGVDVKIHCEYAKHPVATLQHNFGERISVCDIRTLEPATESKGLDFFMGGPPCQPWSRARTLASSDKPLGPDDERNLWVHMTRLIDRLRPRIVLLENVGGLLDKKFRDYLGRPNERIPGSWWEEVENLGYRGTIYDLFAPDYGTPQARRRVWQVLWPKGAPWGRALSQPPPPTHYDPRKGRPPGSRMFPWPTAYSRLQGGCGQGYGLVNCRYLNNYDNVCNGCVNGESFKLADNEEGGGAKLTPAQAAKAMEIVDGRTRLDKYAKPADAGGVLYRPLRESDQTVTGVYVSRTLTKDLAKQPGTRTATLEGRGRMDLSCPVDEDAARLRQLTVREAAKLQDIPSWYSFKGSVTSQFQQVGNGIPMNMGRAVIRHALKALRPGQPSPRPGTMAARADSQEDYTGLWAYGVGESPCQSVVPISDAALAAKGYTERKGREAARRTFSGGDPNVERRLIDALVSALDELALDDAFVTPGEEWVLSEFAHILPRFTQQGGDYGVPDEEDIAAALRKAKSWRKIRGQEAWVAE